MWRSTGTRSHGSWSGGRLPLAASRCGRFRHRKLRRCITSRPLKVAVDTHQVDDGQPDDDRRWSAGAGSLKLRTGNPLAAPASRLRSRRIPTGIEHKTDHEEGRQNQIADDAHVIAVGLAAQLKCEASTEPGWREMLVRATPIAETQCRAPPGTGESRTVERIFRMNFTSQSPPRRSERLHLGYVPLEEMVHDWEEPCRGTRISPAPYTTKETSSRTGRPLGQASDDELDATQDQREVRNPLELRACHTPSDGRSVNATATATSVRAMARTAGSAVN